MEKTFEWSEDGKVLLKLLDNGVKEVVVPDGVVTIGDEAFKRVDLNKCTLCVSEENLEACRLHPVLSKFKHIVTFVKSDENG